MVTVAVTETVTEAVTETVTVAVTVTGAEWLRQPSRRAREQTSRYR
jgi:hypothetical protein